MMNLDQAIAQYEQFANVCKHHGLTASQEEFEQLAAWLKELQDRQKMPEVIRCSECAFCRPFLSDKVCSLGLLHNISSDMDFCSRAVRKPERRPDGEKQSD